MITEKRLTELVEETAHNGIDRIDKCDGMSHLYHGHSISQCACYAAIEADTARLAHDHDDFYHGHLLIRALLRTFPSVPDDKKADIAIHNIPTRFYEKLLADNNRAIDPHTCSTAQFYDAVRGMILDARNDLAESLAHTLDIPAATPAPTDAYIRLREFFLSVSRNARAHSESFGPHYLVA